jgi:hypothetical protein
MIYPCIILEIIVCNRCGDKESKLNDDGMTEEDNTPCPLLWQGHKKIPDPIFRSLFILRYLDL